MTHSGVPQEQSKGGERSKATVHEMLDAILHPDPSAAPLPRAELMQCVESCITCATVCTACADACLGEEHLDELASCILMTMDCADICHATGQVLLRQHNPESDFLHKQITACKSACERCAALCEQHAKMHAHCRACAEACRQCEAACDRLLLAMSAS